MKHKNIMIILFFILWQIIGGMLVVSEILSPAHAMLLYSILSIVIALWLFGKHLRLEWQRLKSKTRIGSIFARSFGLFILVAVVRVLTLSLFSNYIDEETLGANQQNLQAMFETINPLAMLVITVISAPLVEELTFREAFNGWVPRNNRPLIYFMWVLSSFLFAAGHVFQLQDFIIYLPLALALLLMYVVYDNNVWASMIFHFVNNGIGFIAMLLLKLIPQDLLEQAANSTITAILELFVKIFMP